MSPLPPSRFPGLPDRLLERYLCGELPPTERTRIEEAARAQPPLAAYLEARARERDAYPQHTPFAAVAARLERTRPQRRPGQWLPALLAPALAAGLALWMLRPPQLQTPGPVDVVRRRGGLTVRSIVKRGEEVFQLEPGQVLRAGDRVRLEVEDAAGGWACVVALSERGAVTLLQGGAPMGGPVRVTPGRQVLPGSIEMDAGPEREALYVVLASRPLLGEDVARWLNAAARGPVFPPLPPALPGSRYTALELPKEAAP